MSGPPRLGRRGGPNWRKRRSTCCAPRATRPSLTADERDIVTYVRQLMRTNRVDQSVFDRLNERHGVQWMVEMTAIANYYAMLSGVVNAFDVAIPPDGDRLAPLTR